jgi:hypothetical protein
MLARTGATKSVNNTFCWKASPQEKVFCSQSRLTKATIVAKPQLHARQQFARNFAAFSSSHCLVVVEHDNSKLQASTFNTISAASQLSSDVTVLLAGNFQGKGDGNPLAKQIASISGVKNVVVADNPEYSHSLPERYACSPAI